MQSEGETQGPVYIGISFGTLYSSLALLGKDGRGQTVANEDGDRNIPSYYAFTGHEELAGSQAKIQAISNPSGTIVQFRNLLGKKFDDEEVQHHSRSLPMNIVALPTDATIPAYEVESWADPDAEEPVREHHTVGEVTTKFFGKMKETAENLLGKSVEGVVISIPPHFEDEQKAALLKCTKDAGFQKAYAIHEPVAAALAFDTAPQFQNIASSSKPDRIIAVLDLGGHQFNVSILACNDGVYTILASLDDYKLGGVHFDEILVNWVKQEFKRKTKMDFSDNRRALTKARAACEQTKRALTRQDMAPCSIESLYEGMDFHGSINRGRFEMMAEPLYGRCGELVKATLKEAGVGVEEVDEVLFVGGSGRMPRFQTVMKGLFGPSTDVRTDVEPDEAISIGCATQAAMILASNVDYAASSTNDAVKAPHLTKSIGLEVAGGAFAVLVPRLAVVPARRTLEFGVAEDGQKEIYLAVYEGDDKVAKKNSLLAEIVLGELPEGLKKGEGKIEVSFTIEADQVLTVFAKEKSKGAHIKVKVHQKEHK